jgi:hypothetical protein
VGKVKQGVFSISMQQIQDLGIYVLRTKNLQKVRVESVISLVAKTRLGLFPQTQKTSEIRTATI